MAQALQTNRRLLSALVQASNYYRSHSNLTSRVPFRCFVETPSSAGFSVSFADGSLETLLSVPEKNPSDEKVQKTAKIVNTDKPRKEQARSADAPPKTRISKKARAYTAELESEREVDIFSPPKEEEVAKTAPAAPPSRSPPTKKSKSKVLPPNTRSLNLKNLSPRAKAAPDPSKPPPKRLPWQIQKAALAEKFGSEPWAPRKRLSPDTIDGIRALHAQYPERYTTPVLAEQFAVSAEAIRRILKSKWSSNLDAEKQAERRGRWARRHDRIWDAKAEMGLRPARKVERKVEEGDEWEEGLRGREMLQEWRGS